MFYQTLAGAWPAELVPEAALSDGGRHLEALRLRLLDFMEKMGREAKLRTTWTSPDAAYEEAIALFVSALLSPPRSEEHTSELQSIMRTSYAVFCLKTKSN